MIRVLALQFFILCSSLLAQPLNTPAPKIEIDPEKPDEIIAHVDGEPISHRKMGEILVTLSPQQQDAVRNNPVEALRMYGWMRRLSKMADEQKLAERAPYKQKLEMNRMTLLSEAMMQTHEYDYVVSPEMQKGYYERMKDRFSIATVKVIYLPFTNAAEELQAKQKAEEAHAKLKAGADFTAVVKEYSKDTTTRDKGGEYPPIKRSDDTPEILKNAIFALKKGEFSGPVRNANGYFLFQMVESRVQPYAEVKDQIFVEIKQNNSREFLQGVRNSIDIKVAPAGAAAPK